MTVGVQSETLHGPEEVTELNIVQSSSEQCWGVGALHGVEVGLPGLFFGRCVRCGFEKGLQEVHLSIEHGFEQTGIVVVVVVVVASTTTTTTSFVGSLVFMVMMPQPVNGVTQYDHQLYPRTDTKQPGHEIDRIQQIPW